MVVASGQARDADRVQRELDIICADEMSGLTRDIAWVGGTYAVAIAVASVRAEHHAALVYRMLVPYAGRMGWQGTTTYGPVDYALGALAFVLGDHARAREHLGIALDLSRQLRAPLHEHRAAIGLAVCGDAGARRRLDDTLEDARVRGWIGVINDAELVWRAR